MGRDLDAEESFLDRALELLDEGRFEEAIEVVERVAPERGERWVVAGEAALELSLFDEAEDCLNEARELLGADHPDALWLAGRLALWQWRLVEARRVFGRLDPREEGAALLENLAILADLEGDHAQAHALLVEAHRAAPGLRPAPLRMDPGEFEKLVRDAAGELPLEFQGALEETAVVIDPMPSAEVVDAPASGHPPDLLGLFVGLPFSERDATLSGELPPTIFLFQRNLERACADWDELRHEIGTTLYHELGHALGFDEDGVDDLGLA